MRRTWLVVVGVGVAATVSSLVIASPDHRQAEPAGRSGAPASAALQRLRFEQNQGQADPSVRYLVRDGAGTLFLTPTEAVLSLRPLEAEAPREPAVSGCSSSAVRPTRRSRGWTSFPARPTICSAPIDRAWHVGIPNFGRVRYEGVYPGVDVVFHGARGALEYDIVVAPGTDLAAVRMAFVGPRSVALADDGGLLLRLPGRVLRQDPPTFYQLIGGDRRLVAGGYVIDELGRVGIRVTSFDRTLPLVIDPVISYSTYVGGEHSELANAIAVDSSGSAYVTGQTDSYLFPTKNAFDSTFGGGTCGFGFPCRDAFVTKLNASGNDIVYSTYLGGSSDDMGHGIGVDASGNAYVTGNTGSTNFPVKNAIQPTFGGGTCGETGCIGDAFLTKLSVDGSVLVYSTYLGGGADDQGNGVAVDSVGRPYVVGFTVSIDFPTHNAFQPSLAGIRDGFMTKPA